MSSGYSVVYWKYKPFTHDDGGIFYHALSDMLVECAETIPVITDTNLSVLEEFSNARDMLEDPPKGAHFLLPVTRSLDRQPFMSPYISKRTFIPMVESPGVSYIIELGDSDDVLPGMVLQTWPLLTLLFVLSVLAGCVVWMLERLAESKEFETRAGPGIWDGFWWAWISMTTVGYGDHKPASALGRVYAMIWILIGIIIFSVFTAILATASNIESIQRHQVRGVKVGVVNATVEQQVAYAHGADVTVYNSTEDSLKALKNGEIYGMMMDNLRTMYFASIIEAEQLYAIEFYNHPSMHGILAHNLQPEVTSCLVEKSEIMQYRVLEEMTQKTAPIGTNKGRSGSDGVGHLLGSLVSQLYIGAAFFICSILILLIAILIHLGKKQHSQNSKVHSISKIGSSNTRNGTKARNSEDTKSVNNIFKTQYNHSYS